MANDLTSNDLKKGDQEKAAAARASLRFVHEGNIVGLGTGSTAAYAIRFLGERVRAGLKIRGIPTSVQTKQLATSVGIPLTTLDEFQEIDVTIDGADEFDADPPHTARSYSAERAVTPVLAGDFGIEICTNNDAVDRLRRRRRGS